MCVTHLALAAARDAAVERHFFGGTMSRSTGARDGAGGRAGYTGRTLVLLAEGAGSDGHDELHKRTGIRVTAVDGARAPAATDPARGNLCFDRLGVAVVE